MNLIYNLDFRADSSLQLLELLAQLTLRCSNLWCNLWCSSQWCSSLWCSSPWCSNPWCSHLWWEPLKDLHLQWVVAIPCQELVTLLKLFHSTHLRWAINSLQAFNNSHQAISLPKHNLKFMCTFKEVFLAIDLPAQVYLNLIRSTTLLAQNVEAQDGTLTRTSLAVDVFARSAVVQGGTQRRTSIAKRWRSSITE